jgi:type II restriction enzyme
MLERLDSLNNPSFFFLNYEADSFIVTNFVVIPKHYFLSEYIEKRPPLPETARRAGWIGCNILLTEIPESGKIYYIKNKQISSKEDVMHSWKKTAFLRETQKKEAKGWLLDLMKCIEKIDKKEFNLKEVYAFEHQLAVKHINNKNIRPKIRQQLQILRDKGYLRFISPGVYVRE